jgi:hypothetical protein
MKCSACGQEKSYIPLPFVVEEGQTTKYAPGTYNICADCLLDAYMVKCGVTDKIKKWFKK